MFHLKTPVLNASKNSKIKFKKLSKRQCKKFNYTRVKEKEQFTAFHKFVNEVKVLLGLNEDFVTDLHHLNVCAIATLLAIVNQLNQKVAHVAGILHDIAKYKDYFQALVSFKGTFTPEMRKQMAGHAKDSAEMVRSMKWIIRIFFRLTAEEFEWVVFLIENHHIRDNAEVEAMDIPEELKKLLAVMIISDVYDAVRASRSYKVGFSVADTFVEMHEKDENRKPTKRFDKQFNPSLFKQLKNLMLVLDKEEVTAKKANA